MALESRGRMTWKGDPLAAATAHRLFSGFSKNGLRVVLLPDQVMRRNDCTPNNAGVESSLYVSHCRKISIRDVERGQLGQKDNDTISLLD